MFEAEGNRCALGDVADTNPETLPGNTPHSVGFRYIDLSAVEAGFINWGAVAETTFGFAPSRARRIVKASDILFGTVRPNLKSHGFIGSDQAGLLVASTGFSVVRAREGISHPSYLFHSVMSSLVTAQAVRNAIGSSYPAINDADVKRFQIFLPPYREQQKIAQVLDTLDTAIQETESIIAKLKAVKQGLLHDLLTRGIDASGELRPSQVDAPQLYKESPLGRIPTSWQVAPLSSRIASLDAGVSVNSEDRPHGAGEVGVLKTSALSQGRFFSTHNKAVVPSEITFVREAVLGDSILVSRMNTPELVGESCYVSKPWPTLFLPDRIWQLKKRSPDSVDMRWLSYVFLTPRYRAYVQVHATGTSGSMKNLPKSRLFAMPVAFPDTDEQQAIATRIEAADERVAAEASTLEKLRAQKSGLMDDLLTGRVRVTPLLADVERAKEPA